MSRKLAILVTLLTSFTLAIPVRREVPQEHSHERFVRAVTALVNLDNPDGIVDGVFGLLGNAAAANGAGNIADPTCLQQATADRAFTNAKAAGNVQGQVDALIYRALEKNTLQVGLASEPCTSIQAVNPEIAAIQQHQDPASPNAAAINKAIVLELARQINSVGGNPLDALLSGTFAPGDVNDPTARGNSCNVLDDPEGCIFTQNLLVPDATPEEIEAAVAGAGAAESTAAAEPTATASNTCPPQQTVTVTADPAATQTETVAPAATTAVGRAKVVKIIQIVGGNRVATVTRTIGVAAANTAAAEASSENLQRFNGALGGAVAPSVIRAGRGFQVEGNASFLNLGAAINRSCDVQANQCANIANSAEGREIGLSVGQCNDQRDECRAANA